MNVDRVIARQFVLELADRLEERQAFDVADGAADLDQHEIIRSSFPSITNSLIVICNVGDHLHGRRRGNRPDVPSR